MLSACECGSVDFSVEYQTTARLNLNPVAQVSVTYGPVNVSGLFSTVTCNQCGMRLDVDSTGVPEDVRIAFIAARHRADAIAANLATVTVRARTAPAGAVPLARPDGSDTPTSASTGSVAGPMVGPASGSYAADPGSECDPDGPMVTSWARERIAAHEAAQATEGDLGVNRPGPDLGR